MQTNEFLKTGGGDNLQSDLCFLQLFSGETMNFTPTRVQLLEDYLKKPGHVKFAEEIIHIKETKLLYGANTMSEAQEETNLRFFLEATCLPDINFKE